MQIVSVNLSKPETVVWRGKPVKTGIFKYPVDEAIKLGKTDVEKDAVIDRRYHGGTDKACYLYSADHYPFWQEKYPELEMPYGLFGENITVEGMNERQIMIGDIYSIGACRVQVTQPREPCFKLGLRFNSQKVIKDFIAAAKPGIYVKIIETGEVQKGDVMRLSERLHDTISLLEVWDLLYQPEPDEDLLEFAVNFQHLAESCKSTLRKKLR